MFDTQSISTSTSNGGDPPSRVFRVPTIDAARMRRSLASRLFGERTAAVQVGRYEIRRRLGMGGMSVVYAAYDARLDREVAIKVMHDRFADAEKNRRLMSEAQALARLSHPNVVQVFEVGEHGNQIFIAMELLPGQTLGERALQVQDKAMADLSPWVQAAKGLGAAHEAGLVHRDFKPENVMVLPDGLVKVFDFGVAVSDAPASGQEESDLRGAAILGPAMDVAGTPAYMAPEQLAGRTATARSDQFGYCVSLFEFLTGERPFPGEHRAAIVQSMEQGVVSRSAQRGLPGWLRALLKRGLAIDPSARYPDMASLLQDLEHGLDAPRKRRVWGMVLGTGLAVAGASWAVVGTEPDPCETATATWEGLAKTAQIKAPPGTRDTLVHSTYERIRQQLVDYVEQGRKRHLDACRSALARPDFDAGGFLAQSSCYSAAARSVPAFVARLQVAGVHAEKNAMNLAASLPSLDACDSFSLGPLSQKDAQARAQLEQDLATAQLHVAFSDFQAAERAADALIRASADPSAQTSPQRGLEDIQVRSLLLQANVFDTLGRNKEAVELADRAYRISGAMDDPGLRLQAAVDRSKILAHGEQGVRAVAQLRDVYPLAQRQDVGLARRFYYFERACVVEKQAYALCENYARCVEGLELAKRHPSPPGVQERLWRGLAWVMYEWGAVDHAIELAQRSRDELERELGKDSLLLAPADFWLQSLQAERLRVNRAPPSEYVSLLRDLAKTLDKFVELRGENSRIVMQARINLAEMLRRAKRYEESEEIYKSLKFGKPKEPGRYLYLTNRGRLLADMGRSKEAIEVLEQALADIELVSPPQDQENLAALIPERAEAQFALALAKGFKKGMPHALEAKRVYGQIHSVFLKQQAQAECKDIEPGRDMRDVDRLAVDAWIAQAKRGKAPARKSARR